MINICTEGNSIATTMLKGTDDEDNIGASADGYGSDGNGDSEISITSGIRTIRRPSLLDANSKNDDNDDIAVKLVRSTSQHDSPSSSSSSSSVSSSASSSALCSITTTVGSQNRNQHETQQQQQQPQDNDNDTCSSTTIFYSSIIIDDISTLPPLSEPRHGIMKEESSRGICLVLTVIVLLPIVVHYIALTVILPSSDPDDSDNNYLIMLPGKMTFLVLVYLEITLGVIGLCGILYVDPCVIHRSKETCFPIPIQVESYIIEYQQYSKYYEREQQLLLQQQQQQQQETIGDVINYQRLSQRTPPTILTQDQRRSLQPPLALRPPRPPKESYIQGNKNDDNDNNNNNAKNNNDVYCTKCLVWRRRRGSNNNNSTSTASTASTSIHYFHCAICQRCCAYHDHHCGVFGRCISGNIKSYWNWNWNWDCRQTKTITCCATNYSTTSTTGNILYFGLLLFVGGCTYITIFSSFIYAFAIRYGNENLKYVLPIGLICMAFISCCCFPGNYGPMNIICWPFKLLCRIIMNLINRIIC